MAADLERYLNDEPIVARPPSAGYRVRKFVRRNRARVAAGSFALVVLITAVLLITWQAVRATRAERSSRAVKDFLVEQVFAANPYVASDVDPNRRALLDRFARNLDTHFTNEPLVDAELRMVLGLAIGSLGDIPASLPHTQRAFEIRQRELGLQHSDTLWSLAWIAQNETFVRGSTQVSNLLEQTAKKIQGTRRPWSSGEAEVVWTYGDFIVWQVEQRPAEALPYLYVALAQCKRMDVPKDFRYQNKLGVLADVLEAAGRMKEAEAQWKENTAEVEREFGPDHLLTAQCKRSYAAFLHRRGRRAEALPLTNIGPWAFSYCAGLTRITIPDGVATVGRGAFYSCTSLTNLTFLGQASWLDRHPRGPGSRLHEIDRSDWHDR